MNGKDGVGKPKGRPGVDAQESARWRSSTGPAASAKKPAPHRADPCAVGEEDLKSLGEIHALLRALNDAYAGGNRVGQLIGSIPVLSARIIRRARKRFPAKGNCTLAEALTLIGNIGLESELLQLLEDLTVMSAELTPPKPPA
jgi:hypothetical protein